MSETISPREALLTQKFDVIAVMGSTMQTLPNGNLGYPLFHDYIYGNESPTYIDGDLKAQAILEIYRHSMAPFVIITGGIQDSISRAEVLAEHTSTRYDVPSNFLRPITTDPHTLGNIFSILDFLNKNQDVIKTGELGFLSMSGHLRRLARMSSQAVKREDLKIRYLSSEVILQSAGKLSVMDTKQYYQSPEIQARIASENQGIYDLNNGIYTPRS